MACVLRAMCYVCAAAIDAIDGVHRVSDHSSVYLIFFTSVLLYCCRFAVLLIE